MSLWRGMGMGAQERLPCNEQSFAGLCTYAAWDEGCGGHLSTLGFGHQSTLGFVRISTVASPKTHKAYSFRTHLHGDPACPKHAPEAAYAGPQHLHTHGHNVLCPALQPGRKQVLGVNGLQCGVWPKSGLGHSSSVWATGMRCSGSSNSRFKSKCMLKDNQNSSSGSVSVC